MLQTSDIRSIAVQSASPVHVRRIILPADCHIGIADSLGFRVQRKTEDKTLEVERRRKIVLTPHLISFFLPVPEAVDDSLVFNWRRVEQTILEEKFKGCIGMLHRGVTNDFVVRIARHDAIEKSRLV